MPPVWICKRLSSAYLSLSQVQEPRAPESLASSQVSKGRSGRGKWGLECSGPRPAVALSALHILVGYHFDNSSSFPTQYSRRLFKLTSQWVRKRVTFKSSESLQKWQKQAWTLLEDCVAISSPVTAFLLRAALAFLLFFWGRHCACPSECSCGCTEQLCPSAFPLHPGSCLVLIRKNVLIACIDCFWVCNYTVILFSRPMFLWLSVTAFSSQEYFTDKQAKYQGTWL